jgi:hypothetical protein
MRISIFLLSTAFTLVACGSSSPENFFETSTRISCRYVKKCEKDEWDASGFDSVRDCVDQILDTPARDLFVAACDDFDSSAARKCLAGLRKARRQCDLDAASGAQERACRDVCGNPTASELFTDPRNEDAALMLLQELEADGALD